MWVSQESSVCSSLCSDLLVFHFKYVSSIFFCLITFLLFPFAQAKNSKRHSWIFYFIWNPYLNYQEAVISTLKTHTQWDPSMGSPNQIAIKARVGPVGSQALGAQNIYFSPVCKHMGHLPLLSKAHYQGSGSEIKQSGCGTGSRSDASVTCSGFTQYTVMLPYFIKC